MLCFSCFPAFRVVAGREVPHARQSVGEYNLTKTIARGSFASVCLGEHFLTKQQVAIKRIETGRASEEDVAREISLHKRVQHPNVVAVYGVIFDTWSDCIVLELAPRGDLVDHLAKQGRMHEDRVLHLFQQLAAAVGHCHKLAVAHRDLKLDNLLLSDDFTLKLADFGLAREMIDGDVIASPCGSPSYLAPELLDGNRDTYKGAPADVYSCGVVLFGMLTNALPFQSDSSETLYKLKQAGVYMIPNFVSGGAQNLLREILLVSPSERITLEDMRKNSWFKRKMRVYRTISTRKDKMGHPLQSSVECDH